MKQVLNTFLAMALGLMVLVPAASAELANGQQAPDFTLTDVNGASRTLSQDEGKFRVLEWTNHGCPFVIKHYDSGNMQKLQATYTGKGVVWLTINSSAEGKQGHYTPQEWQKILAEKKSAATATLLDPDGKVGKLYGAQTTPHIFIINPDGKLIYQGAIDDKASQDQNDIINAKNYVVAALDQALAGQAVSDASTKAYGCSVKYA